MWKQDLPTKQRNSDAPLPRIEEKRVCPNCGTVLSSYNTHKRGLCSQCQSAEARASVARTGSKAMREHRAWTRRLVLRPADTMPAPEPVSGQITLGDLQKLVAYECGVSIEDLNTPLRGAYYNRQVARTIFIYLTHRDVCKSATFSATATFLNIDLMRVRTAKVSIEDMTPRPEIAAAIKRIRAYYKPAAQAAA